MSLLLQDPLLFVGVIHNVLTPHQEFTLHGLKGGLEHTVTYKEAKGIPSAQLVHAILLSSNNKNKTGITGSKTRRSVHGQARTRARAHTQYINLQRNQCPGLNLFCFTSKPITKYMQRALWPWLCIIIHNNKPHPLKLNIRPS
jgi:hypothetical protein